MMLSRNGWKLTSSGFASSGVLSLAVRGWQDNCWIDWGWYLLLTSFCPGAGSEPGHHLRERADPPDRSYAPGLLD